MLVPDYIRKVVCFIGIKKDGEFQPMATGFFVAVDQRGIQFTYLVTADHVVAALIAKPDPLWVRVNTKDASADEAEIPSANWIFPEGEDRTDVAAIPIAFDATADIGALSLVGPKACLASQDVIDDLGIGIGEEIAIVGLFRSHYGLNKNIPVVRVGNISAMPEEKIKTREYGYIDAYLVEARSIGGLSGSPVFVVLPPQRILDGGLMATRGPYILLLGLMHGHFDVQNMQADVVTDRIGDEIISINTGMGVVIPASAISTLLMSPDQIAERDRLAIGHLGQGGAVPDLH